MGPPKQEPTLDEATRREGDILISVHTVTNEERYRAERIFAAARAGESGAEAPYQPRLERPLKDPRPVQNRSARPSSRPGGKPGYKPGTKPGSKPGAKSSGKPSSSQRRRP